MPFFKTENGNAENIKYDDTKSVKEVIDDIKDTAMFIDSFNTDTGTLNTTSESGNSSGNQTASSVTFDNTDTGLEAANVQDAIEEVNGKLQSILSDTCNITTDQYGATIITFSDGSIPTCDDVIILSGYWSDGKNGCGLANFYAQTYNDKKYRAQLKLANGNAMASKSTTIYFTYIQIH